MGVRDEHIKIHLTEAEKEKVQQIAENQGLSVSSWGRTKIKQALPQEAEV